jgi:hypothetical protein
MACGGDRCTGAWATGGASTTGLGMGRWIGGTGTGAIGGTTTGTGATGAAGIRAGAAGSGAGAGGFNGLGAAIGCAAPMFGLGTAAWTGAGACCIGTMRCWPGVGCKATVVLRIPIASAISSASTALMPTTANPLPISRTGLRRGWSGSCANSLSMTTVGALASSSGTAL